MVGGAHSPGLLQLYEATDTPDEAAQWRKVLKAKRTRTA
jgi:hypothetical protein